MADDMTPLEERRFDHLELRLFGEDGTGGAFGRIETLVSGHEGRLSALERDRIAREAVAAATSKIDEKGVEKQRWQMTTYIAVAALVAGFAFQLLGALGVLPQ